MSDKINFTKQSIERLPIPIKGFDTYKDEKEKGLSLYVTRNGIKTFFVRKRIKGKDERVVIGTYPEISIDNARKHAMQIKSEIAQGKNPVEERNAMRSDITFGEMFEQYIEKFAKKHKKTWKYDDTTVRKILTPLFNKKAMALGKHDMQKFHDKLTNENGKVQANRILNTISSIFNRNIDWGWSGENPCQGIQKHKEKSRDRFMEGDEIGRLFKSLKEESNTTIRDYIMISLLTGARRGNVVAMQWKDISFERSNWRIPDTKNGDVMNVHLTPFVIKILEQRLNSPNKDEVWVFSGVGKTGHLVEPKTAWRRILKRANIRDLRLHDLRRTMGSYQAMEGASLVVIGKSLGHKSPKSTAIYSHLTEDAVRQSMRMGSDKILGYVGDVDIFEEK